MANVHSQRQIAFTFAGRKITGFAKVDSPIDFPNVPLYDAEWGYDSGLLLNDVAQRGGMVTLKLQPTSPDCDFFISLWNAWSVGAFVDFLPGLYVDQSIGKAVVCAGGALYDMPIVPQYRKNFEVQLVFEEFQPFGNGRRVVPPPPAPVGTTSPFSGSRSPLGV